MDFSDNEYPDDDKPTEYPTPRGGSGGKPKYRECLKNHAVTIGGHAVDGCGEFMPSGEEGSIDSLRCAACNCHRNFHRKDLPGPSSSSSIIPFQDNILQAQLSRSHQYYRTPGGYLHQHQHHHQYGGVGGGGSHGHGGLRSHEHRGLRPPDNLPPATPLALPSSSGGREEDEMSEDLPMDPLQRGRLSATGGLGVLEGSSGGDGGGRKKRLRTKFTQEQKVRMLEFAEKVGWRIQKHDEAAMLDFCNETGVKRHVLKVWMHNNKHTLGKKVVPS